MNWKVKGMWKEVAAICFKILCLYFVNETEEDVHQNIKFPAKI